MNEEEICNKIEELELIRQTENNRVYEKVDYARQLQQEKEKNKKLEDGIRRIIDKLELEDYYNCQDGADDLTRLLQER